MSNPSLQRSVWGASTDELKERFRSYLKELAATDKGYRRELIDRLEWCFDRWNYWREKFYPETTAPMMFPFFKSSKGGSEFGHYATIGDSGEPSVIHVKRSFLMGERDITLVRLGKTKKLVLKAEHPERMRVVDLTILHELVHQYLFEGADRETRIKYETSEAGPNHYKGHGSLFRDECNRINRVLHPERGFDFVPVRHSKKTHEPAHGRLRPSCAQFTKSDLFFCWDPSSDDLTDEQDKENSQRLLQALQYFGADEKGEGGAVELVTEEVQEDTDFPAPYDPSCADVCINQLTEWDRAKTTNLVRDFHVAALQNMQELGVLDQLLQEIGFSAASTDIPASSGQDEPEVNVPAHGDSPRFSVGDWVHHSKFGSCEVVKTFGPTDNSVQTVAIETREGPRIVSSSDVRPCEVVTKTNVFGGKAVSINPVDVPAQGDKTDWLQAVEALHAEGWQLRPCVEQVINTHFNGQKPDRKTKFGTGVRKVFGVSRQAVSQAIEKALETNEALAGAA